MRYSKMRERVTPTASLFVLSTLLISLPVATVTAQDKTAGKKKAVDANIVKDALPYTLTIEQVQYDSKVPPLPGMQAYVLAESKGKWLVVGGRTQGLHTFYPAPVNNFPVKMANKHMWVIDPKTGESWSFDVTSLPIEIADPLQANNQQEYHDRQSGEVYIVGGYGFDSKKKDMVTFNTIIRFPLDDMIAAVMSDDGDRKKSKKIRGLIDVSHDDRFAVTGGELRKLGQFFCLTFGQKFMGQYHAFSSGSNDTNSLFTQKYTEEVRAFTLRPNSLEILSYGAIPSHDPSRPFHRRDGVIIDDVDPSTGRPRIAVLGGVFRVGTTGGFTQPIHISDESGFPQALVDDSVDQLFSQYQCPVVVIHDEKSKATYRTLYGGISHYFYHQTEMQKAVYDLVNQQERADGLPFVSDITTFSVNAEGKYEQFIMPDPIDMIPIPLAIQKQQFTVHEDTPPPGNPKYKVTTTNLLGSSVNFILNEELVEQGLAYPNGALRLQKFPEGETVSIGHFYGGIAAVFPYALIPNFGTWSSNAVFEVKLTHAPSDAIPAKFGKEANPVVGKLGR